MAEDDTVSRTLFALKLAGDTFPFQVILCETHVPGFPIVYANRAFYEACGYPAAEFGRFLSKLQGPKTNPKDVEDFKVLVATGKPFRKDIVNYGIDGGCYVNRVVCLPFGPQHHLGFQLAMKTQVAKEAEGESAIYSECLNTLHIMSAVLEYKDEDPDLMTLLGEKLLKVRDLILEEAS